MSSSPPAETPNSGALGRNPPGNRTSEPFTPAGDRYEPLGDRSATNPFTPRGGSGRDPPDGGDNGNGDPPEDNQGPNIGGPLPAGISPDVMAILQVLATLLAPRRDSEPKEKVKIRDPDPFDESEPDKLQNFLFQCQLEFKGKPSTYRSDEARIYYAISFLKGSALDFFEPAVLDKTETYNFLLSWPTFKNKLVDNFGSSYPEDEAKNSLEALHFEDEGKATKFFVQFAEYKSRTRWNDRAYYRKAYKALPTRLKDKVNDMYPKPTTFSDLRAVVLQIDHHYWEYKHEKKMDKSSAQAPKAETSNNNNSNSSSGKKSKSGKGNHNSSTGKGKSNQSSTPSDNPIVKNLGSNSKLLPEERQRCIDKGLCLVCSEKGHVANACPKRRNQDNVSGSSSNSGSSASKTQAKGRTSTATANPKTDSPGTPASPNSSLSWTS